MKQHQAILSARLAALNEQQLAKLGRLVTHHQANQEKVTSLTACVLSATGQALDPAQIKQFVASHLPDYFVPTQVRTVQEIPRSPQGKIDRQRLAEFDWQLIENVSSEQEEEDWFSSGFAAPRNPTEQMLAQIWCDVLGTSELSIHDNFVEVGGDSLLSIRILARINKAGYSIAPEDFFEFPTIAQQALCIDDAMHNCTIQGDPIGVFAMIPIQHWLFDRIKQDPQHWNQAIQMSVATGVDLTVVQRSVQQLMIHHDALRSRFIDIDGTLHQQITEFAGLVPLEYLALEDLDPAIAQKALLDMVTKLHQSFALSASPLIRFVYASMPADQTNKLVIIVHHLIIDAESWRILLDDLNTLSLAYQQNSEAGLMSKSTAFGYWSKILQEHAHSQDLQAESEYWYQHIPSKPFVLCEHQELDRGAATQANQRTLLLDSQDRFNESQLTETCKVLNCDMQTLLIFALVKTLQDFTQSEQVWIDIEGHGRANLAEEIDLTRTVGWFSSVFPQLFILSGDDQIPAVFRKVKRQIDTLPRKGIGHGLLKYLARDPQLLSVSNPPVCFNYLGKTDSLAYAEPNQRQIQYQLEHVNIGQPRSPQGLLAYQMEINGSIASDRLCLSWAFNSARFEQHNIAELGNIFLQHLADLIDTAQQDKSAFETSVTQFDLTDLDDTELSSLAGYLSEIDSQD
jgi:non-ribosomal peptide synthase protein (TIGR01720 family)